MPDTEAEDIQWMRRARHNAREGSAAVGGNPIGCVIVRGGAVIGEGYNEVDLRSDPTAHSEIVAMRRASEHLRCVELRGATLYTTLQPCGMCTMASIWAKVSRIVYGAGRAEVHEMYFEDRHMNTIDFIRDAYRDDLSLRGGVLAGECAALYVPRGAIITKDHQFNR